MHKIENINRDNFVSDELLSLDMAAALIGVTGRTLYRMRLAGIGPSFRKIGNAVIYPRKDVLAFIAANTSPGATRDGAILEGTAP
jgi:predicted DNA-binding transcriptional regulator AlpA